MGFTEKSDFWGSSRKTNKEGGFPKNIGLGQFSDLRGAWKEKGGVFEGFDIPIHTMFKHVGKLFEVGCLHQHIVIALYLFERNEKLLEIFRVS